MQYVKENPTINCSGGQVVQVYEQKAEIRMFSIVLLAYSVLSNLQEMYIQYCAVFSIAKMCPIPRPLQPLAMGRTEAPFKSVLNYTCDDG